MSKKKPNLKRWPRSAAKYIRREKAKLRREVLGVEEYKKRVNELYQKFI